jgi:hypothetical protein
MGDEGSGFCQYGVWGPGVSEESPKTQKNKGYPLDTPFSLFFRLGQMLAVSLNIQYQSLGERKYAQ